MRTDDIPIDNVDQAQVLELLNSPPKGRLRATWELRHLGRFRVYLTIVGPQPEESQCYLSLRRTLLEHILQTVPHLVKLTEEELR